MTSTTSSPSHESRPYVLGTGEDELSRLGLQHRLWADAAVGAWKLAGIGPGSSVLDVGCGPGFAAFDLAQLVTPAGRVVGIDESANFIEYLRQQASARGLTQLSGCVGDVQRLDAADTLETTDDRARTFDAAYARWVLCFTPEPERVVRGVASRLRPGGRFVIHDYFNYTTMTLAPRRASHDELVRATAASWRSRGGDPDIAARLPAMLDRSGLDLVHIHVHQRIARGGQSPDGRRDPMLAWPLTWWRTFAPKLVTMGLITPEACAQGLRDLDEVAGDASQFVVCPPVYELIGVKR